MPHLVVTIDGPAASGKSTVARLLAGRLGATFLDTGAMYRAVTLVAMQAGVDLTNEEALLNVLHNAKFEFGCRDQSMIVSVDGVDVTEEIRDPKITANARHIASAPKVRHWLVQMQRQFAAKHNRIVTEGRDQGTVAFADADAKFYLTADIEERARRRLAELQQTQRPSLEDVKKSIARRDASDRDRRIGPLKPAQDAITIDTTDLNIQQVVEKIYELVKEKCSLKG